MNLYDLLGVSKEATQEDIKQAYREKVKLHHPDKGGDPAQFRKIQRAYDLLMDPVKRQRYDQGDDLEAVEQNRPDPVITILTQLFVQVIQGCEPDTTDVFQEMRRHISSNISGLEVQVRQINKSIEKLEKAKKRIKVDSNSLFAQSIDNQVSSHNQQMRVLQDNIALGRRAIERLGTCVYTPDKAPDFRTVTISLGGFGPTVNL